VSDEVLLYEVWDGDTVRYSVSEICEVAVKDGLGMGKCGRAATHRYTCLWDAIQVSWPVCANHAALMAQYLNRHDTGDLVALDEGVEA
jgi:hypothetical protein